MGSVLEGWFLLAFSPIIVIAKKYDEAIYHPSGNIEDRFTLHTLSALITYNLNIFDISQQQTPKINDINSEIN